MSDKEVKNIYPDEQTKIDDDTKDEMELTARIMHLLDDYGYTIEPTLVNGLPEIKFMKI